MSQAAYWIVFGVVVAGIGIPLAANAYGAAQNFADRWRSTLFTVRVIGVMMMFLGVIFAAGGIYHLIK